MARTNRNLDVDMDYSKIVYDKTDGQKKVESVDLDAADDDQNKAVVIAGTSSSGKPALRRSKKRKLKEKAGISKIRKQSVLGTVIICALLAVMLVVMVQGRIEINETSKQIATLKKDLSTLEAERKELNSKLDSETDMLKVEEYAQKNGMVYSDNVNRVYVGSDGEDDVQVYEPDEELFGGFFGSVLSAVSESFLKTWNTISGNE